MKKHGFVITSAITSLLALSAGCGTTMVSVNTTPEKARVFIKPMGSGEMKPIGETPLVITGQAIREQAVTSGPVYLEIQKMGYETERILITEFSSLDLQISRQMKSQSVATDPLQINAAIDGLFEAQRLARLGQYEEALKSLEKVQTTSPNLSAIYEIRGGVYYLMKRYAEAYDAYNKAIAFNPGNPETIRMREMLYKQIEMASGQDNLNGRAPAQTPGQGPGGSSQ